MYECLGLQRRVAERILNCSKSINTLRCYESKICGRVPLLKLETVERALSPRFMTWNLESRLPNECRKAPLWILKLKYSQHRSFQRMDLARCGTNSSKRSLPLSRPILSLFMTQNTPDNVLSVFSYVL